MKISEYNRSAWDKQVEQKNIWTQPVNEDLIKKARNGEWQLKASPMKPVPRVWFGDVKGKDILCLASGGGQQGPILAAAGANVVVFDNSPKQLAQDTFLAERDDLNIRTELGDILDLSRFAAESFDFILNLGIGNVENIENIFQECYRITKLHGVMIML